MKRQSTLSLVIAVSLLISIVSLPSRTQAQQSTKRFRGDTGVMTLGIAQVLRITVNGNAGADMIRVRFAWMKYMPAGCNTEGVCRHVVQSEGVTAPVNVGPNQAASFEVQGTGNGVRVEVRGDFNADGIVSAQDIINSATGEVTNHVIMANTEG